MVRPGRLDQATNPIPSSPTTRSRRSPRSTLSIRLVGRQYVVKRIPRIDGPSQVWVGVERHIYDMHNAESRDPSDMTCDPISPDLTDSPETRGFGHVGDDSGRIVYRQSDLSLAHISYFMTHSSCCDFGSSTRNLGPRTRYNCPSR
jgi:hypothetical protein